MACGEEFGHGLWRRLGEPVRPFERRLKPGAAPQVVLRTSVGIPTAGCAGQLAFSDDVDSSVLQPARELRPGSEHDLVDDVDGVVCDHYEPRVDECVQSALVGRERTDRDSSASPHAVVGDVGK